MEFSATRPLALVTGASNGIGLELAKQFAHHGFDLLVTAADEKIHAAASELHDLGARANAVQVDLRTDDGVDELWRRAQAAGRPIEAAALIADLDCRSTGHLAGHVIHDMRSRDEGRILYAAPRSFALALRDELKDTGVTVTSLMPAPMDGELVARDCFTALMAGEEQVLSH